MGRKILLADDSITIQKVVNLTFSDEGIEVIAVSNGETAVNKLDATRPDIVLADIFMPGRNGYEVCEYVKTHPQFQHLPVLLLVGAFEPFDKQEALRVKADGHLTKPFESRTLIATVKRLLERVPVVAPPPPPATPAFAPPPSELSGTQIFGSARGPSPTGELATIVFDQEPSSPPAAAPPPSTQSGNPIEEGRPADLTPLTPPTVSDVSAPPPPEPTEVAFTLPDDAKPALDYPKPPTTQYRPVTAPSFGGEADAPVNVHNALSVDAQSPLELDDEVIHSRREPTANLILDARDPLLDTFADVAILTAAVPSAFDPQVETTAHAGTDAAFVSAVSESAASETAPPFGGESATLIRTPLEEAATVFTLNVDEPPRTLATDPESAPSIVESADPAIFDESSQASSLAPAETFSSGNAADGEPTFIPQAEVVSPPTETPQIEEIAQPEFTLEAAAARDIPPPPQDDPAETMVAAVVEEAVAGQPDVEPSAAEESYASYEIPAEESSVPALETFAEPVAETPVFEPSSDDPQTSTAEPDFLPTELAAALKTKETPSEPTFEDGASTHIPENHDHAATSFTFTLPPEPEEAPADAPIFDPSASASSDAPSAPAESVIDAPPVEALVEDRAVAPPSWALDAWSFVPESVINQIVQRVVAQLSEKVVREIAWEVVPDLAELLIKERLSKVAVPANGAGSSK
jgi:CheY-like chemotaxis protein